VHALGRKQGPGLEPCTETEGINHTAGTAAGSRSKDLKQRALEERSENSHTLQGLHKEAEADHRRPVSRWPQAWA